MVNPHVRTLHECRTYHEGRGHAKRRRRWSTRQPASFHRHSSAKSDLRHCPHTRCDLVHARGHNLGHDWRVLGRRLAPDDWTRYILDPSPFGYPALWSVGGPHFGFPDTFDYLWPQPFSAPTKSGKRKDMGLSRPAWSLHCRL